MQTHGRRRRPQSLDLEKLFNVAAFAGGAELHLLFIS
jgi:hypothetical protein